MSGEKFVQVNFVVNSTGETGELCLAFKDPKTDDEAIRQLVLRRETYRGSGELLAYRSGSKVFFGDHNRYVVTILKPIIVEKSEVEENYGTKRTKRKFEERLLTNAVYEHHGPEDDKPRTEIRGARVTVLNKNSSLLEPA